MHTIGKQIAFLSMLSSVPQQSQSGGLAIGASEIEVGCHIFLLAGRLVLVPSLLHCSWLAVRAVAVPVCDYAARDDDGASRPGGLVSCRWWWWRW